MCGQSFFNNFVTDVDTQTSLRQFYLYLDLESPVSIQAQLRSFFVNLNPRLEGVLSESELTLVRELTYEPYFNSLVFVIRILALFETRIDTEFTFDPFNQLTFDSVDWESAAEDLNDETGSLIIDMTTNLPPSGQLISLKSKPLKPFQHQLFLELVSPLLLLNTLNLLQYCPS